VITFFQNFIIFPTALVAHFREYFRLDLTEFVRIGVIYSIDGGKWLIQEAQFSQTSFGSPVQSFAVLVNFTSTPHPAGSIKYAVWIDMGDGSKRWDNNNGEDYFVAFPQPTPEAIIKSVRE
jgi:hypothetical protein